MNDDKFPMRCSLDIDEDKASISSVVYYYDKQDEYYALDDTLCQYLLILS
ncbi:hypothetical protein [Bacillus sp. CHD6a]|nr:hypothetical protein [Bacillus sp. CHD6a]